MLLYLIRHGKTAGNLERRYVGRTDEPLCQEGIRELKARRYPPADRIVASPMRRCLESAAVIYGDERRAEICDGLREMDFGVFEYHTYGEMQGWPSYQAWLDGGGLEAMPGGESRESFSSRCVQAFEEEADRLVREVSSDGCVAFVVHGGTIMAVMERFGVPKKGYYDWQMENGQALLLDMQTDMWKQGKKELIVLGRIE